MCHHIVAQPLFAAFIVRQDIQPDVAFLITCAKAQDDEDWEKLKQVMKYLNGCKTSSSMEQYLLDTVPRERCGLICSPNLCRDTPSVRCAAN